MAYRSCKAIWIELFVSGLKVGMGVTIIVVESSLAILVIKSRLGKCQDSISRLHHKTRSPSRIVLDYTSISATYLPVRICPSSTRVGKIDHRTKCPTLWTICNVYTVPSGT